MGDWRRYITALSRHHRSGGFGIHSPFAFRFVRNVLRERLPYYAYQELETLRQAVLAQCPRHSRPVIGKKDARMLFRIVNAFSPTRILQIGTNHGVTSRVMMAVSSTSRLWLYKLPDPAGDRLDAQVLRPVLDRVDCFSDLGETLNAFGTHHDDKPPLVLIDDLPTTVPPQDITPLSDFLRQVTTTAGVIVMRGIHLNDTVARLWEDCRQSAAFGQTFSNGKWGILVSDPKLQREHFDLWL